MAFDKVPCDTILHKNPANNQIQQMLNPIVRVRLPVGYTGSGIIFGRKDNYIGKKEGEYKYFVLTNNHVIEGRKSRRVVGVDGIRGRTFIEIKDHPVSVTVFIGEYKTYSAKVVVESSEEDLAVATFESTDFIDAIVAFPSANMIGEMSVFDPVYLVSCQLGYPPMATSGIVSAIATHQEGYPIYISDVGTAPGSSGGGLFKKYGDDYYIVAIAQGVENGHQIFPHIGYFIPVATVIEFLESNHIEYGLTHADN